MLPCFPTTLKHVTEGQKIIRHVVKTDRNRILEIDADCFIPKLTEKQINDSFESMDEVWKGLEIDGKIVGFSCYQVRKFDIKLVRLGIDSKFRNRGYASFLLKDVYRKLNCEKNKITCWVSENSDVAIKWLKQMGFTATAIKWGESADDSDAFAFRLVLPESLLTKEQLFDFSSVK